MNAYRQFPARGGRPTYLPATPMKLGVVPVEMFEAQPYAMTGRKVRALAGDEASDSSDTYQALLDKLAPIARALVVSDPVQDVEVLRAKIANQTALMRKMPEPAKTLYRNNIAVLQAKLRAAEHAKRVELDSEQAQRTWRVFGYTLTGTGVVVGLAGTAALLSLAGKYHRSKRKDGRKGRKYHAA